MFWRRKREEPPAGDETLPTDAPETARPADAPSTDAVPPDDDAIANDGPWEPDSADFEAEAAWGAGGAPPAENDPEPTAEPIFFDAPEPEPVQPTVEPSGSLDQGLARTRGGFMSRLRGFLGGGGPDEASWDDVEETLIGGDVGAALAMDVVERARRRRDPDGAEAAVRAELSALLVPRDAGCHPDAQVASPLQRLGRP